ncbi:hypothetical protein BX266_5440 [Streptomyces sp. TLI_171]|nr:hypothetical protein BX266_5440 [Streptomyces sp. TLI_171]
MPGWENLGPLGSIDSKEFVRRVRNFSTGEEAVLKYLDNRKLNAANRRNRFHSEAREMQ